MPDPETLAREAAGDSVTPARLVGDADGFPNLGPYLQSGQEPQHMVPLDTGDVAVEVGVFRDRENEYYPEAYAHATRQSVLEGATDAVAVLTWDELLAIVHEAVLEVPYAAISGVLLRDGGDFEVHRDGARDCVFYVSSRADETSVRAAVGHLRSAVRRHRSDGR